MLPPFYIVKNGVINCLVLQRAIEFEPLEFILSNLNLEDTFDWTFNDTDIAAIMNTSATTGQFKSVPLFDGAN